MPPGHFIPANHHVLVQLCRHIVEARNVAVLKKQQAAESLIIARLSRAMRLTQQATFKPSMRLPKKFVPANLDDV
jgi:hypothetical protein